MKKLDQLPVVTGLACFGSFETLSRSLSPIFLLVAMLTVSMSVQARQPWSSEVVDPNALNQEQMEAYHRERQKRFDESNTSTALKHRVSSSGTKLAVAGSGAAAGAQSSETIHPGEIQVPEDLAAKITKEIRLLAYGLEYDPVNIYNFVHNRIDMHPLYGIGRSAMETLIDKRGNDFEQAALMVALLRASGIASEYVYGGMLYTPSQLLNWWGSGLSASSTVIARTWVRFNFDGKTYDVDPAHKEFEYLPAIDFQGQLGFDVDELVEAAKSGASFGENSIQNFNTQALNTKLNQYTSNLMAYLDEHHFDDEVDDILGGRRVVQKQSHSLDDIDMLPHYVSETWQSIPLSFHDTMAIRLNGVEHQFLGVELGGKRLTVTFNASSNRPQLMLDGELILAVDPVTPGSDVEACFYPQFYWGESPTGFDCKNLIAAPTHTHALANSLRGVDGSLGAIDYAQEKLQSLRNEGFPDDSEQVKGETLNIIGRSYMSNWFNVYRYVLRANGYGMTAGRAIGWVSETTSGGIDWDYASVQRVWLSAEPFERNPALRAGWHIGTAFEAGVFDHVYGKDNGLSTSRVFDIHNEQNGKLYYLTNENFAESRGALQNWSNGYLNWFETALEEGGGYLILPDNGEVTFKEATASAWISYGNESDDYDIGGYRYGGSFNGGGAALEAPIDIDAVAAAFNQDEDNVASWEKGSRDNPASQDPVDMLTGFLVSDKTDLVLGGNSPLGLSFGRQYSSRSADTDSSVGRGWQHSAGALITVTSQPRPYLGFRTPREAAAMIVYAIVAPRVMADQVNCYWEECISGFENELTGWMAVNQIATWFVEQTVENSINVHQGFDTTQFVRLPDGSFSPPPGSTLELTETVDGFLLKDRAGTEFIFDTDNRMTSLVDIDGNSATFDWNDDLIARIEDAYGRSLDFTYNDDHLSQVSDSAGRSVTYAYDLNGNLISVTNPGGKTTTYGYDAAHRLISIENALGEQLITNEYNEANQVIFQTVHRDAGDARYQYRFNELVNVEIDPAGNRTSHHYDFKGRNVGFTDALGQHMSMAFDGQNRGVMESDFRGNRRNYHFDKNHNMVSTDLNGERKIDYVFNEANQLVLETDSVGNGFTSVWGEKNKLLQRTNAEGETTEWTWDERGRMATETEPGGTVTSYSYDVNGNLSVSQTGSQSAAIETWDDKGNRINATDPAGAFWQFAWDARSLPTGVTDPLGKTTTSIFDDEGRLSQSTDRNGRVTTYTWTRNNLLKTRSYQDGNTLVYGYDLMGRLISIASNTGSISYSHDVLGRVTSQTGANGDTTSFEYDADGNITAVRYADNRVVSFTYNSFDEYNTITNWLGQTMQFAYDSLGRLVSKTGFNGTLATYTYDKTDRLVSTQEHTPGGELLSAFTVSRNARGHLEQVDSHRSVFSITGNIDQSNGFNTQANRILNQDGLAVTNDDEGRVTSVEQRRAYGYDDLGRVTSLSGDINASFFYDAQGRKSKELIDGVESRFVYDLDGNQLVQTDESNQPLNYFIYAGGRLVAMLTPQGETFEYHFDLAGNTIGLTDEAFQWVNQYRYTPFGTLAAVVEQNEQPFRYSGEFGVRHLGADLFDMRARLYDAEPSRFNAEDPLFFDGGGYNLFAYVANNPVNYTDPLGLRPQSLFDFSQGAFDNAVTGYTAGLRDSEQRALLGGQEIRPAGRELGVSELILNFAQKKVNESNQRIREQIKNGTLKPVKQKCYICGVRGKNKYYIPKKTAIIGVRG